MPLKALQKPDVGMIAGSVPRHAQQDLLTKAIQVPQRNPNPIIFDSRKPKKRIEQICDRATMRVLIAKVKSPINTSNVVLFRNGYPRGSFKHKFVECQPSISLHVRFCSLNASECWNQADLVLRRWRATGHPRPVTRQNFYKQLNKVDRSRIRYLDARSAPIGAEIKFLGRSPSQP